MPNLFHTEDLAAPHLTILDPDAAMPGGEVEIRGTRLGPDGVVPPQVTIGELAGMTAMSRADRSIIRVPNGAISGDLVLARGEHRSNALPLRVAVPMAENLHPIANPAVDADGRVYTTFSGARGQNVPVSVFRIERDYQMRPFIRELMNASGLAIGPDGYLHVSSRSEGLVYRCSPDGAVSVYAQGLGIATGLAFDRDGNLFVGDRSGTIFKIAARAPDAPLADPDNPIFVFATLEPSVAAYHLAFNEAGTLFVTGPTISSNQAITAIDRDGNASVFYRGLGRPQGMAFDTRGNLYVAASLHGRRGLVRITPGSPTTPPEATLILAGSGLVGLAFLEDGCAALATNSALYHVDLGIDGRNLAS
jgi:sugar lactone lactonase YvrE